MTDDCTANDDATRGRLYCLEVPKHVVVDCTANDDAIRGLRNRNEGFLAKMFAESRHVGDNVREHLQHVGDDDMWAGQYLP